MLSITSLRSIFQTCAISSRTSFLPEITTDLLRSPVFDDTIVAGRTFQADQLCVAAASQHFFDFSNVQLLASYFRASKFLKRNALRLGQLQQSLILTDSAALVKQQFLHDVIH